MNVQYICRNVWNCIYEAFLRYFHSFFWWFLCSSNFINISLSWSMSWSSMNTNTFTLFISLFLSYFYSIIRIAFNEIPLWHQILFLPSKCICMSYVYVHPCIRWVQNHKTFARVSDRVNSFYLIVCWNSK